MREGDEHTRWRSAKPLDRETILATLEREKGKMYGIAYAYLRNEEGALEAIQETACRVWVNRVKVRKPEYLATWMIRILIHVCMDERKKQKQEQSSITMAASQTTLETEAVERLEMEEQLAKLPPHLRMVIVLKYYRDMTITQVAEMMEKPDGTIRTWLHKALQQLRTDMTERKEVDRDERLGEEGSA
ncbi:sigma-70 family RNA polymerase sigma factor [Paenibacillus sp. strain BS8-2]